jgi:nitrite reductase/ring-hydroxylating ferredoxin subunit/uncharacterized membrane protein
MASQEIANLIDAQDWLDGIDPLQKGLRDLLSKSRALKDALHGTWLGHPLHPVLTDIPVGAWTVAIVCDALESLTGSETLGSGADAAVAVGLLGAVGAAVTGLTDWSETDYRAKKVGTVHAALNVVATSLYTASWIMRGKQKTRASGVALSMLGYAIAGASAYLGGHLVFGEQVGVDHTATADSTKPDRFTPVIRTSELRDGQPTRVVADGVAICLVKRGDDIRAITDTCPHLGGPLSEGKLEGDVIRCPWHGSGLSINDGSVANGPTTYPARVFDVRVQNGQVEVRASTKQATEN